MEMLKFSSSKLLLEMFATGVLTMLFITGETGLLLIGLWILTIFCWKISSAQLNPAVTFAFVVRRDSKRMHIPMALLMIIAQVLGAWAGAWIMAFFSWSLSPMVPFNNNVIFAAMWQETFGTMIFVIFFKLCTDETLYFSKEQAINCFIIASSYIASRAYFGGNNIRNLQNGLGSTYITNYGACLNPAIALGIFLTSIFFSPGDSLKWVWLYPVMPFAGAIFAVIFYELVYKKTQMMLNAHSDGEGVFDRGDEAKLSESTPMDGGVLDD